VTAICDRTDGGVTLAFAVNGVLLCEPIGLAAEQAAALRGVSLCGVTRCHTRHWDVRFEQLRLLPTPTATSSAKLERWLRQLTPSDLTQIQSLDHPLNGEQMKAVADVVSRRHESAPYVIFGPPGTGV
jgi:hypothetical protein